MFTSPSRYSLRYETPVVLFLFFVLILHPPAQSALIPDAPLRYLPSGHVFDSGVLFNAWSSAMKNYIESSFPDQKVLDEMVQYKRSKPSKMVVNNEIMSSAETMNDIGLLRFGKREA